MSEVEMNTTYDTQSYAQYCTNRLPCGYCRLMSSMCPLVPCGPSITWTYPINESSEVIYGGAGGRNG